MLLRSKLWPVAVIILPCWLAVRSGTEEGYRYAGAGQQLVGLLLVFLDLKRTARSHSLPSTSQHLWSLVTETGVWKWLFPQKRRGVKISATVYGLTGSDARMSIDIDRENATDAEKIGFLLRQIDRLEERTDNLRKEMSGRVGAVETQVGTLRTETKSADSELAQKIKDHEIGGLPMALAGLAITFCGTVLGSFGPEFVSLWSR